MGMYDDVTCEADLPRHERVPDPGKDFQTKDLECQCYNYVITKAGRLIKDGIDLEHHGYLRFHDFKGNTWWEYRAKFTDGQLQGIELLECYTYTKPGEPEDFVHHWPVPAVSESAGT